MLRNTNLALAASVGFLLTAATAFGQAQQQPQQQAQQQPQQQAQQQPQQQAQQQPQQQPQQQAQQQPQQQAQQQEETQLARQTEQAQQAPAFMRSTLPEGAVAPAYEEFQAIMSSGALDQKTKELIGLGVAAQVPCDYCVYYHTTAAKALGATDAEIKEALASAALVRKWSTMLNGSDYDQQAWRSEVDEMFGGR